MRCAWLLSLCLPLAGAADLTRAVIVPPSRASAVERKAIEYFSDAVAARTRVRLATAASAPAAGAAIEFTRAPGGPPEGFRVLSRGARVTVTGNGARGLLFGAGYLLRKLELRRDSVSLPRDLDVTTAPKYALRGHQLGYRPKTNSYDAWDVAMWDRYIGDLAVFGANAIELIPPRSDDAADSPHFPLPPLPMMTEMSRIAAAYGMDVWIWYPAMDKDNGDPASVARALKEWGEVFAALPRVDAVFVPGGDPGHTQPKVLFDFLEKQTANLHKYHPQAAMWVSPQGFSRAWMDEFFTLLERQPAWLSGVVFGPQVRLNLPELRARVPKRYPIRNYPDITHSLNAQYTVRDWDAAFALTEEREGINPRPRDEAHVFRVLQPYADRGFLTYSEGCNDDVNKAVWSGLGWDPAADVTEVLRDYARYFIGPDWAEGFAQGLLALERNWDGALAANAGVETTLAQFQAMERAATPQVKLNWRFQQGLYRAYYDAYVRARLLDETAREQRALEALGRARESGPLAAVAKAEAELTIDPAQRAGASLRARLFELAEALFQSARMQLSVPRYQAIDVGRGANLDLADRPLNNRRWLEARWPEIRAAANDFERLQMIDAILNWSNPGPGGFYDELGNPQRRPHLDGGAGWEKDPAFFATPRTGFGYTTRNVLPWRLSWHRHAEALYGHTLKLRYDDLQPGALYKVRVTYAGDPTPRAVRLTANEKFEVHPLRKKDMAVQPVEFDIPAAATAGGKLTLEFHPDPEASGNGRFVQVAEAWLIRR